MSELNRFESLFKGDGYNKILALGNEQINKFLARFIEHLNPSSIFVWTGTEEETNYIRQRALELGEERKLATEGHTAHFDGYNDQARDKAHTKFLVPKDMEFDPNLNYIERESGLSEMMGLMKGIMTGRELLVLFFSLGPANSEFTIPSIQLTDSPYVAHSETILYRAGYESFKNMKDPSRFFKFVHSEGELENNVSKNLDKRRIYIDLIENTVYSANTQYGGNTLGLKKLAMRLAIQLAAKEGWLTEHMFVMGINGPNGRVSYFTGAYPSMCGKTSTAMLPGELIVGDDIAYLRKKDGTIYAVNVEKGMFGIIEGINQGDDPIIWDVLHKPNEIIFSNILIGPDNLPYWNGMGIEIPDKGINHSGEWFKGKKDDSGKEIPPSHKNARFTLGLDILPNVDKEKLHSPEGVKVAGIIYGGRDSDTSVPVEESFDWVHGIVTKGASLESETTAATLGQEGVRKFNPMSNLDFLSIPIAKYIEANINFGKDLPNPPKIFGVNYFLRGKEGNFLNERLDKAVWLKWMELRCHGEVSAIETPTGLIPVYEDLKELFEAVLNKPYSREAYEEQFTIRVPENIAKIERIEKKYREDIPNTPSILFEVLQQQKERLKSYQSKYGDYISPFALV